MYVMTQPMKQANSAADLPPLGLQRRLLEVAVVVGADEETGLHQRKLKPDLANGETDTLFQMHFNAHLLDILSGAQDSSSDVTLFQGAAISAKNWKTSLKSANGPRPKQQQSPSKIVQRKRSVRHLRKRAGKAEAISVSTDFLSNLPYICLPDDSKVYRTDQSPDIHFAVLTDVSGTRHYAGILRLSQAMYAHKDDGNGSISWKLSFDPSGSPSHRNNIETTLCYVPLCICFVTSVPYFDVIKSALSCLCKEWKDALSYGAFRKTLQKFVTNLSIIACPPPNLSVSFSLAGWPITMHPSAEISQPHLVDDLDLSLPLFVFLRKEETLLQVLACILLEQRIVFVSENYALIVLVVEALLSYISPFVWPHQYVPLLFSEIIDFVACPGIFLMGCHIMHQEEIKQVENDQILVDLDTGQAFACPSFEWSSSKGQPTVKSLDHKLDCRLPSCLEEKVLKRLSLLKLFDASKLNTPSPVSVEGLQKQRSRMKEDMNKKVKAIFMEMMVDLFSRAVYFLDHEANQFRNKEFMETVTVADLPFYIKVVKTYMFKRFIKDRLKRVPDTFSELTEARHKRPGSVAGRRTFGKVRSVGDFIFPFPGTSPDLRNKSDSDASLQVPRTNSVWYSETNGKDCTENDSAAAAKKTTNITEEENECLIVTLPPFPVQGTNFNAAHFYRRCADIIGDILKKIPAHDDKSSAHSSSNDHTTRASCLLLRGLYLVASGSLIQGLEDLHEIAKQDVRLDPRDTIKAIIGSLSPKDRELIRGQPFYKGDEHYSALQGGKQTESLFFNDDDLPYTPLDSKMFAILLQKSDVTSVDDVIQLLFDALSNKSWTDTSSEENTVDPEAFAAFYESWKQCRYECEMTLRSILQVGNVTNGTLRDSEKLLKVSGVVSSTRGSGRLLLTTEKILFMTERYEECKLVLRLTQLEEVRLTKMKTFFRSTPALALKQDDNVHFRVALKSESELWKLLIEEMKTGRMLSRDWKDHQLTLDTAAQNVGVADAIHQASKDEGILNMSNALTCVKKLCHFTELQQSGQLRTLPQETDEMLVLKIDVSPKEAKKSQVNGFHFATSGAEEAPRVWIALSSSKIRFIDTSTWILDPRPIKDCTSSLTCMCSVGKELWVGASDKAIYVIDCDSLKKTKVLHDHTAPVLAVFYCGTQVVSATSRGEVIVWNKEAKTKKSKISLPAPHHELVAATAVLGDVICCCSKFSVSLYTLDGNRGQLLTLNEFFTSRMVDAEITCCQCTEDEIFVGDSQGSIYMWYRKSSGGVPAGPLGDRYNRFVPKCTGVLFDVAKQISVTCIMITQDTKLWVGNSVGDVTIFNGDSLSQERVLKAHDDVVTSLCHVENRYVISGSRSGNGMVVVWRCKLQ